MHRIWLLLILIVSSMAHADTPNVIVFMADDIGLGDIGFYHQQRTGNTPIVPTPNLDRLIGEGMRFSDAHSPASLCAPSRFSMLTGNYPMRSGRIFGVWKPEKDAGIDPKFTTSARLAKAGGYHTAFFGKWGLGGSWTSQAHSFERLDAGALSYGFDYALELPEGIQNEPLAFYENREWMKLGEDSTLVELTHEQAKFTGKGGRTLEPKLTGDSNWDPVLAGPILAGKAVEYIRKQNQDHPEEPFFIYYCSQAVHIPHTPPADLGGVKIAGATPSAWGDMLVEADTQVGMLIDALKDTGVYENTLIIFTSDNGGLNYDRAMRAAGHASSNGFREAKASIYEGGHRVPFIAVWPGRIEPGSESDVPIVAHDVVATVAALAGQPVDRDVMMDSIDLQPILTGADPLSSHEVLLHASAAKSGPYFAIREGDWKLIMSTQGPDNIDSLKPLALFNLAENPGESDERVHRLLARYKEHRNDATPTVLERRQAGP